VRSVNTGFRAGRTLVWRIRADGLKSLPPEAADLGGVPAESAGCVLIDISPFGFLVASARCQT
jgi:hypothetical protein